MSRIDDILDTVPAAYGVAGPTNLPPAIQSQYNDAKVWLRNQTSALGLDDDTVAVGLGAATSISNMVSGSPWVAATAVMSAMEAGLALFGGPIGMAAATALSVFQVTVDMLPHASGGVYSDPCTAGGCQWYGGWNLPCETPPRKGTPNWRPWNNAISRTPPSAYIPATDTIRAPTRCCDDTPVVPLPPGIFQGPDTGYVSGQFVWLPDALASAPPQSFESVYYGLVANALELYINAAGPIPNPAFLADMLASTAEGWNALHEEGNLWTISPDNWPQIEREGFGGVQYSGDMTVDEAVAAGRGRLDAILYADRIPSGFGTSRLKSGSSDVIVHRGPLAGPLNGLLNATPQTAAANVSALNAAWRAAQAVSIVAPFKYPAGDPRIAQAQAATAAALQALNAAKGIAAPAMPIAVRQVITPAPPARPPTFFLRLLVAFGLHPKGY